MMIPVPGPSFLASIIEGKDIDWYEGRIHGKKPWKLVVTISVTLEFCRGATLAQQHNWVRRSRAIPYQLSALGYPFSVRYLETLYSLHTITSSMKRNPSSYNLIYRGHYGSVYLGEFFLFFFWTLLSRNNDVLFFFSRFYYYYAVQRLGWKIQDAISLLPTKDKHKNKSKKKLEKSTDYIDPLCKSGNTLEDAVQQVFFLFFFPLRTDGIWRTCIIHQTVQCWWGSWNRWHLFAQYRSRFLSF